MSPCLCCLAYSKKYGRDGKEIFLRKWGYLREDTRNQETKKYEEIIRFREAEDYLEGKEYYPKFPESKGNVKKVGVY
jgi:hypothetical protein